MDILSAIAKADALKPNAVPLSEKVRWLSELDGMAVNEIMAGHAGAPEEFTPYDPDDGLTQTLLIPEPYSDVYVKYLFSQLDYAHAEFERYNNSMLMFNIALSAFADWYNRTHAPIQRSSVSV